VISATEFKAKCLGILDEVEQNGESFTVTRRGQAVAVLGPAKKCPFKSPRNSWSRRGRIAGDIISPPAVWEVSQEE
jgi:prevent-host-death family protein